MGRRRIHANDAARAAAFRRRRDGELAVGGMSRVVLQRPTVKLLHHVVRVLAAAAEDPAQFGEIAARALLEGLEEGAGGNCADAARNFVRNETAGS